MLFKKFDMISPPITLFFNGDNKHSSIFSGILTILAYLIILIISIYYALEFINKENPTAFFFNKYIEDAGHFPLNASSIFHFIQLQNTLGEDKKPIDFDIVRIIGIENITIDNYPSTDLEKIPHWLYGICNNNTDTKDIGYLITLETYSNCACIRKYYNPNTKEYYDTNSNNFVWPSLEHGMSNQNYVYYGIIVEKCKEDNLRRKSGLQSCKSNDIIDSYIYSHIILLYFIDHYSDVLNYKNPFKKYLYSVSNMFFPNSYTVNNLNFNPAIIKTHNGIVIDNIVEELSHLFNQNEKTTIENKINYDEEGNIISDSTGIVSGYYFWMQNRLQFYERNYKRLQDTLSDIGGISRIILVVAVVINTLVSDYIMLLNTEELFLSLNNYNSSLSEKSLNHTKIINNLTNPPKKQYYHFNSNQKISNSNRLMKHGVIYQDLIEREDDIKIHMKRKRYFKNPYIKIKEGNTKDNIENEISEVKSKKYNYSIRRYEPIKTNVVKTDNEDKEHKEDKEYNVNDLKEKQNFSFCEYIKFRLLLIVPHMVSGIVNSPENTSKNCICNKSNNLYISYYEEKRNRYLSEENIIKGQLNLYILINYLKKNRNVNINELNTYE